MALALILGGICAALAFLVGRRMFGSSDRWPPRITPVEPDPKDVAMPDRLGVYLVHTALVIEGIRCRTGDIIIVAERHIYIYRGSNTPIALLPLLLPLKGANVAGLRQALIYGHVSFVYEMDPAGNPFEQFNMALSSMGLPTAEAGSNIAHAMVTARDLPTDWQERLWGNGRKEPEPPPRPEEPPPERRSRYSRITDDGDWL